MRENFNLQPIESQPSQDIVHENEFDKKEEVTIPDNLIPDSLKGNDIPKEITRDQYNEFQIMLIDRDYNKYEENEDSDHNLTEDDYAAYWIEKHGQDFHDAWWGKVKDKVASKH